MVDYYYYWYKRNKLTKKEKEKRRCIRILSGIMKIIFTPLFLLIRIYDWVWSMDYYNYLKRHKD